MAKNPKKQKAKATKPNPKTKLENVIETGKFMGSAKGFGFVAPSNKQGADNAAPHAGGADKSSAPMADIFIPPHLALGALHGDIVSYKIIREDYSPENKEKPSRTGKVTEIINRPSMVGAFFTKGNQGFVKPTEAKIPYLFSVPPKTIARFGLADGYRVVFSVDKRMDPTAGPVPCFITEVIGHINDPGVDILTLVRQADIPYEFSEKVMDAVNQLPDTVTEDETAGRLDLRGQENFTIDGEDTKDIDDAVSFKTNKDGTISLGVHIADVTHYVREFSPLDDAALDRGTSIYLADRVIPMLPHKLSSGICSLFPKVDRLALSCLM
ncbi:MAG: RNB domain-containing ribonuclease, partial [Defluviitaleaceae bacterium]|nr:RNB domain-containing ribonuclease [Defluviitaleaceae bacterium]